jgi:hypothetical protein
MLNSMLTIKVIYFKGIFLILNDNEIKTFNNASGNSSDTDK